MILIDADVFTYAAGRPSKWKEPSAALILRIGQGAVEAVTDAAVLQEILHRYRMLGRLALGLRLYRDARLAVPLVLPVTDEVMDGAHAVLSTHPEIEVQDAVHASVCARNGIADLCSYDRRFDRIPGLRRLEPQEVL